MLPRILATTIPVLLLTLPSCAQENLCPNPGFQQLDDAGWAEGWDIWPARLPEGASVTVDTQLGHSDAIALRIDHANASSYTRAQCRIPVEPGAEYLFSAWIRCEDVEPMEGAMGARLYVEKSSGDRASRRMVGTTPWTELRIGPIDVGTADHVNLMCYLHLCSGTVWFDDITVLKVTDEVRLYMEKQRTLERVRADISSIWDLALQADDQEAMEVLNALGERAAEADLPAELDYQAGPPYFPLEAEVFAVAAAINRRARAHEADRTPVVAWIEDAFAAFPPVALAPQQPELSADLVMCTTDREQALLRLCDISEEPVEVTVQVGRFPGEGAPSVTAREVICVDPDGGRPLKGDALPLLDLEDGRARMTLAPGLVRGVYLQIDADGAAPGEYVVPISVSAPGAEPLRAQVRVRVLPVTMPEHKPIVTWNYSYESDWIMPQRWDQARRDLVEHHINAYCWPARYLPWPELDEAGAMKPLDWTAFDRGLQTHDNIEWLLLWPGFEWEANLKLRNELEPGSDRWREVFTEWFLGLRAGLDERGFGPERIAWYLSDEPCNQARARAVTMTGEVIREIAPDSYVLANPYPAATWDLLRMMDPVVNLWCPSMSFMDAEHLQFFREGSEILWAYQVLPKGSGAFEAYRLSFWRLWDEDVTGQGFWAYASARGSAWNPWEEDHHDYAPIYDGDPRELIPSVRWEAWREGVEDYTLLWMLERAIEEDEHDDPGSAKRAVEEAVDALAEGTPEAVAAARRRVLRELAR